MTPATIPSLSNFLWGNTAVSGALQTSLVTGSGFAYRFLPPKDTTAKKPLIIALHGAGEVGTDGARHLVAGGYTGNGFLYLVSSANPENGANFPCFFAAPQSPSMAIGWSSTVAALALADMLKNLIAQYPAIDTNRIYLTGLSMGGFGAYDLPYLMQSLTGSQPFACTVPMSGNMTGGRSASAQPKIPIWSFHAVNDPTVPDANDEADVAALRAAGLDVTHSLFSAGGHAIWPVAYQDSRLLPWMFSQTLGKPSPGFPNQPSYINGSMVQDGGVMSFSSTTVPPVSPSMPPPQNYKVSGTAPSLVGKSTDAFNNVFTSDPCPNPLDPNAWWTCVGQAAPVYGSRNTTAGWYKVFLNW